MKVLLIGSMALIVGSKSYAALNILTHHSRANCFGFNETVSWDGTGPWYLHTISIHRHGSKAMHYIEYYPAWVWRAAAYHLKNPSDTLDGVDNVIGAHFHRISTKDNWVKTVTAAVNCNIYDGWWDHGSPPVPNFTGGLL